MSNTSQASPYTPPPAEPSIVAEAIADMLSAAAAAMEDTDAGRAAVESFRDSARRGRLATAEVHAGLLQGQHFLDAARAQGFEQRSATNGALHLRDKKGRSLFVQGKGSSVMLASPSDLSLIESLVADTSVRRATEYLEKFSGARVKTNRRANGEVEVVTQAPKAGQAKLSVSIAKSGKSVIDVACVEGAQCETITRDAAKAMGAQVVQAKLKEAYYARTSPGEPTRIKPGD